MILLFVADPLSTFKTAKDSSFAMMREAARRDHEIWACEVQDLAWRSGGRVTAHGAKRLALSATALASQAGEKVEPWYELAATQDLALADVDAVLMRKDPPFDSEFFYATHLLQQAEREGARVFNRPSALREHPEFGAQVSFGADGRRLKGAAAAASAVARVAPDEHSETDAVGGLTLTPAAITAELDSIRPTTAARLSRRPTRALARSPIFMDEPPLQRA